MPKTLATPKSLVDQKMHQIPGVGKILGVSNGVVYRLISTGQLGHVRVGRRLMVPEGDLNEFLNRTYAPASA